MERTLRAWGSSRAFTVVLVICAFSIGLPTAEAANYYVFGRVYSANQLAPGQTAPNNPLTGSPASEVVGDNLYAILSRSMVRVTVLEDATNAQLGSDVLVTYDGAYYLNFTSGASPLNVRFVVRDAVTGIKLTESKSVTVTAGTDLRFLLVPAEAVQISGGIPFPTGNTFVFTSVGKIEVSEINAAGFANPSTGAQGAFGIPAYQDAPFGGNLFVFGAFSQLYYPFSGGGGAYCYKIFSNGTPISDPLYKVRYTVNPDGTVTAARILIGPGTVGLVSDCYSLTPIAEPTNVFWSFPDLLAVWRTGTASGAQNLTVQLFRTILTFPASPPEVSLTQNTNSKRVLFLDNTPLVVQFNQIEQRTSADVTETDLLANSCDIAQLSGGRKLFIGYTAQHPTGFLRDYSFVATSNSIPPLNVPLGSDAYTPGPYVGGLPPVKGGTPAGTSVTKTSVEFTQSCAYIFTLSAWARTTDGYSYINWSQVQKTYYIQRGP